jgi:hypothetical protein
MKIELITQEIYNEIIEIQKINKGLTFQNVGYEYINKDLLNDSEKKALNRINEILKSHIIGFIKFNNFLYDKKGGLKIRFQYNYGEEDNSMYFIGVGYLLVNELLNGFNSNCVTN